MKTKPHAVYVLELEIKQKQDMIDEYYQRQVDICFDNQDNAVPTKLGKDLTCSHCSKVVSPENRCYLYQSEYYY